MDRDDNYKELEVTMEQEIMIITDANHTETAPHITETSIKHHNTSQKQLNMCIADRAQDMKVQVRQYDITGLLTMTVILNCCAT